MEKNYVFNNADVRAFTDQDGEFWFVGVDVCNILEYKNPTDIIKKLLDEDERKLDYLTDSSGQKRKTWNINESGLYSLILTSTKPEAKVFKRWITHEVLPSLRKAGIYSTDGLARKNALIQELIKKIDKKNESLTDSKSVTKGLEKDISTLQLELLQLLKANPDQTDMYPQDVWDGLKKQIEDKKE